jgi:hypothetical protein
LPAASSPARVDWLQHKRDEQGGADARTAMTSVAAYASSQTASSCIDGPHILRIMPMIMHIITHTLPVVDK